MISGDTLSIAERDVFFFLVKIEFQSSNQCPARTHHTQSMADNSFLGSVRAEWTHKKDNDSKIPLLQIGLMQKAFIAFVH